MRPYETTLLQVKFFRLNPNDIIKQEVQIKKENEEEVPKKAESVQSGPLYEVTDILSVSPESNSDVEL